MVTYAGLVVVIVLFAALGIGLIIGGRLTILTFHILIGALVEHHQKTLGEHSHDC